MIPAASADCPDVLPRCWTTLRPFLMYRRRFPRRSTIATGARLFLGPVGRGNADSDGRTERSVGSASALVPRVLGDAEVASRLRGELVCRRAGGRERGAPAPVDRASAAAVAEA